MTDFGWSSLSNLFVEISQQFFVFLLERTSPSCQVLTSAHTIISPSLTIRDSGKAALSMTATTVQAANIRVLVHHQALLERAGARCRDIVFGLCVRRASSRALVACKTFVTIICTSSRSGIARLESRIPPANLFPSMRHSAPSPHKTPRAPNCRCCTGLRDKVFRGSCHGVGSYPSEESRASS
jgi:hypothetical protein